MKTILAILALLAGNTLAATAVKVNFTLNTTDAQGAPLTENRYYHVYRPDGFPRTTPLPMILILEHGPGQAANPTFNAKAAQVGLVIVSCSFSGNSTGTPGRGWKNGDPRESGPEDYDYLDAVINRVKASDNCDDVFITGLSKGGHASLAYACERPSMIKAAASLDEFQSLTGNVIKAPVPLIVFQGSADSAVPYT
jgi:poly(3-hydroxybutyrate) depolymerase